MHEKDDSSAMPTERTPLVQVIPVAPPRDRYEHHTSNQLRRFCTVCLIAIPLLTISIALFSVALSGQSDLFGDHRTEDNIYSPLTTSKSPPHPAWPAGDGLSYSELKDILTETPDAGKAEEWSRYYTAGPHLAGQNLSQAVWTKDRWEDFGISSEVVSYDVYINYPLDHRLALLEDGKVKFEATLEEDVLEEDPTTGLPDRVPTFHGYSASGNVTAQYVYVNYGTFQDFEDLLEAEIELEGKIALAKYGGIFRGLKIKRAQELGMIGAVLYSDPGDDGITEEEGYKPYPEGPARNPSSVQRGSAQFLSVAPGDPTTIGYPSKPGVPRQLANTTIPSIPSLPISYAEALPLLRALNGHGPNATSFSEYWQKGGLAYKGVNYNIGPSPPSLTLNLMNLQNYTITPLWNTIGIINGTIPDEVVVLGNHRDAWIAGGAGDPNSGSAAMNEVVRSFGAALLKGWKPQRTIVFASWDGEEYGLIGSTEWVEEYIPWLSHSAVAYLNVDVGARGTQFTAAAAPLLDKALIETTQSLQSPNQTVEGSTIYDNWNKHISTIGSGSDFTAFQDFAGIPCVDMGFGAGAKDPVYHYHSNYDSYAWMQRYGDVNYTYHVAISKVWALLAAKLVEEPIVPFNATDYAAGLARYLDSVKEQTAAASLFVDAEIAASLDGLGRAIALLHTAAVSFDARAAELAVLAADRQPMTPAAVARLYADVRAVNVKYKYLERIFLYPKGLDGRNWFKHVVFAPGRWTGYAGATWPGLVEAIQDSDKGAFKKWTGICEGIVYRAVGMLERGH